MAQLVRTPAAALQQHFQANIAVVIGINDYEHVRGLKTARADAAYLATLLRDDRQRRDELDRYKLFERYDQEATADAIHELLTTLLPAEVKAAGPHARVLFYFAGHGDAEYTDNTIKGYLFPQDAQPREPDESQRKLLPMAEVQTRLAELDCQHVLIILDCCSAGAMPKTPTTRSALLPAPLYWETLQRYVSGKTRQVITSAAHNQQASDFAPGYGVGERDPNEGADHSPFALALFEALAADPLHEGRDLRGVGRDGVVTATELYLTISDSLYRRVGDSQTPGLWTLNQGHEAGDYVFLLPGAQVQLEPAPDLTGPEHDPWPRSGNQDLAQALIEASREAAIRELNRRVEAKPLVAVTGRSDSGKTSLVLGMLLPRLREGVAAGSGQGRKAWQVLPPLRLETQAPVQALMDHLGQALGQEPGRSDGDATNWLGGLATTWADEHPRQRLLLAVDCAEALFQAATAEEQARLWTLLAEAAKPNVLHIILTVPGGRWETPAQADGQSSQPLLPSADRYAVDAINPFNRDGLRQVIEQPAAAKMIFLESEQLIGRMLDAVEDQPAALPLLTETLHRMYMRHATGIKSGRTDPRDRTLTRVHYEAEGSVEGVIADLAQGLYDQWPDEDHRRSMQHVFMRLVKVEAGQYVGDWARQADFAFPDDQAARRAGDIIAALAACGLVVQGANAAGEPYVALGHSGLITAWSQMQKWLVEQGAEWALQRDLAARVEEWQPQKPKTLLWDDDPRLPQVEERLWPAHKRGDGLMDRLRWEKRVLFPPKDATPAPNAWVNRDELAFVRASVGERSGFRQKLFAFVAAITVVIALFGGIALWQRGIANEKRAEAELAARQAQSGELAAQSRLESSQGALPAGLLLATEAYTVSRTTPQFYARQAVQALYDTLEETGGRPQSLTGKAAFQMAVSPDGQWLATGSIDNQVRLWSIRELWEDPHAKPRILGSHGTDQPILTVAFSPDSAWLATGGNDGAVGLWPIDLQESNPQASGAMVSLPTEEGQPVAARHVTFSPKGRWLVVVDTSANTWFYERQTLAQDPNPKPQFGLSAATWGINTEARQPIDFSPDEQWLALASTDESAWLWKVDDLVRDANILPSHTIPLTATIDGVTFIPNSNLIATIDKNVQLWPIAAPTYVKGPSGLQLSYKALDVPKFSFEDGQTIAFSHSTRWIAMSGRDGINLWDQYCQRLGIIISLDEVFKDHNDWSLVAGFPDVFPPLCPEKKYWLPAEDIESLQFSADEHWLVSGDALGRLKSWDLEAIEHGQNWPQTNLRAVSGGIAGIYAVAGHDWIVTQSASDIRLWKLSNPQAEAGIVSRDETTAAFDVAVSPDGQWIATASNDNQARLWTTAQLRQDPRMESTRIGQHEKGQMVYTVAFSPNSAWLAEGSSDGTFGLWSLAKTKANEQTGSITVTLPVKNDPSAVRHIAFSPKGRWLGVVDTSGATLLYDFAELLQSGGAEPELTLDSAEWGANPEAQPPIAFSPDEHWMAVASTGSAAWLWNTGDVTADPGAIPITIPLSSTATAVSFSSDGNWLAVDGEDIGLWEVKALLKNPRTKPFAEMRPPADYFGELAFSSDSHLLAATNQNRTLLWTIDALKHDPHTKPVELHGMPDSHNNLAFGPEGKWIATLGLPASSVHLSIWTVGLDLRVQQACAVAGRNLSAEEWLRYFPNTAPRKTCAQWPAPVISTQSTSGQ